VCPLLCIYVLPFTASDDPFGIFQLFFEKDPCQLASMYRNLESYISDQSEYIYIFVYVFLPFCDSMWSFWVVANLCKICIVCLYKFDRLRFNYHEGIVIPLTICVCLSQARTLISNVVCHGFFVCLVSSVTMRG